MSDLEGSKIRTANELHRALSLAELGHISLEGLLDQVETVEVGWSLDDVQAGVELDEETKDLVRSYNLTPESRLLTQRHMPDYSHYEYLLPDDLTEAEQSLWESAEGLSKKYAAKHIRAWRKVKASGEYWPTYERE